jgi:predicted dehydrogenase
VIVTADPGRAAEAARLYPRARIVPTAEALFALAGDLDLVVLGTPPLTHFDLAATAIAHGLHLVVDKPFVTTAAHGAELITRASDVGVKLTVFQNRRWDADFLTLLELLRDGVVKSAASSRFDSMFSWLRKLAGHGGRSDYSGIPNISAPT